MNITQRVVNAYTAFAGNEKTENSASNEANAFLRYGNRHQRILQDWSQVEMSDEDMYTGYSYAAIKKRANRASVLGKRFLYTDADPKVMEAAKQKEEELKHPYLDLIKKSKEFSQRRFWHDISTYLDLEGVYYLMVVRAVGENADGTTKVGEVQKFVMMNPYNVRRVRKEATGEIGGYIESRDGMYREIPKEMVIEIRLLNPFNNDIPFSMTDAAKENQFTLKQAGDFTRHSIQGNTNAPGIITTDVILEDQIFDNFISRIKNHDKGEPIYGNGAGAIKWQDMQIDLDKAALDKINEIHRSMLFAVSGVSKTAMGIEESGTGREVSKTQKDDFTENAVMPQIEDIIDALNLDYRQWYPEWEQNEYEICLDNPLEADRDAEAKEIENNTKRYELTNKLVNLGYEYQLAARYAEGEITLEELGEPTLEEELTDAEAEEIAMREMGIDPTQADQEPQNGDEVDGLDKADATGKPAGFNKFRATKEGEDIEFSKTNNRFVRPEDNVKKLDAAKKRVQAKLKAKKEADKLAAKAAKEQEKKAKETKPVVETPAETPTETPATPVKTTIKTTVRTEEPVLAPNTVEDRLKAVNQIAARDFPDLYDGLGIDMDKLGCIMVDTETIPVLQFVKSPDADLFRETNYDQSPVPGETQAHVTLLFGLLENGNIWKDKVNQLLVNWKLDTVTIQEVSYFDLGDSYAIVGLVEKTPELIDGHERLTLLPHINTFSEYHPHITLAYIQHDEALLDKWITPLAKKYNGQKVATKGINYGDLPEDNSTVDTDDDDMDYPTSNSNEAKQAVLTPVELPTSHDCAEHGYVDNKAMEMAYNALEPEAQEQSLIQEANLQNAIANLEGRIFNKVMEALRNGDIDTAEEIIAEAEQEDGILAELVVTLAAFYTVMFPVYASQLLALRLAQYSLQGVFQMNKEIQAFIKGASQNAAESHVRTVLTDLARSYDNAYDKVITDKLVEAVMEGVTKQDQSILDKLPNNPNREDVVKAVKRGKFDNDPAYELARKYAREGAGLNEIEKALQQTYANMTKTRAKTIARHEASRVFTMSQYEADKQFLKEAGLEKNAYKRLRSRTGEPCAVCASLIAATKVAPIPFAQNFASLGDELTASYRKENGKMGVQKVSVNYEHIKSGNVHVNCNCEYELVIKQDDGSFLNDIDFRVYNKTDLGYNPYRDTKGRFDDGPNIDIIKKLVPKGSGATKVAGAKKKLAAKLDTKYPGRLPDEPFEAYADRWIRGNLPEAVNKYQTRILAEFDTNQPNVVSADDAKFIIPGFDPERSADYHEPASAFVKQYYAQLLENKTSKHLPVMFTAGGTGAGKSTALRGNTNHFDSYAVVYDGNLANYGSAKTKIDMALKSGRQVELVYVDRDPVTAFAEGVIPRISAEGRAITIKDHVQTHIDSRDTFAALVDYYANNENVIPRVIDNNGGLGEAHEVDVANVAENVYNIKELTKELEDEARKAKEAGQITDGVFRLITNQTADTASE